MVNYLTVKIVCTHHTNLGKSIHWFTHFPSKKEVVPELNHMSW